MLEQTTSAELTPPVLQLEPPRLHIGVREARIEDCLDRCCVPLVGVMPYEARQERRAGLRKELMQLIAAHEELDADPDLALEGALRQLERMHVAPLVRGSQVLRTSETRQPSARPATLAALALFGLPYVVDVTQLAWSIWERTFHIAADAITGQTSNAAESAFYRFELFVVPIIAGLLTGLIARHRAARGVLNAIALLTIPAILIPGFIMGLGYAGLDGGGPDLGLGRFIPSPLPGIVGITYWTALGIGGAHIGGRLRKSLDARLHTHRQA